MYSLPADAVEGLTEGSPPADVEAGLLEGGAPVEASGVPQTPIQRTISSDRRKQRN